MKFYFQQANFLVLLGIFLFSCSENELHDDYETAYQITTELQNFPEIDIQGRLLFDDMNHYNIFMNEIDELSLDELQKENQKRGFISSYSLQIEKSKELGYETTLKGIDDNHFASVLNQNNEFAFKDGMIYQANHDFCFYVPNESRSLIQDFRNNATSLEFNNQGFLMYKDELQVFQTIQEVVNINNEQNILKRKTRVSFRAEWREDEVRLQARTVRSNYGVYKRIACDALAEVRSGPFWNRWKSLNIQRVGVSSNNVTLFFPGVNLPGFPVQWPAFNVVRLNSDKAEEVIYSFYGLGDTFPSVVDGSIANFTGTFGGETLNITIG